MLRVRQILGRGRISATGAHTSWIAADGCPLDETSLCRGDPTTAFICNSQPPPVGISKLRGRANCRAPSFIPLKVFGGNGWSTVWYNSFVVTPDSWKMIFFIWSIFHNSQFIKFVSRGSFPFNHLFWRVILSSRTHGESSAPSENLHRVSKGPMRVGNGDFVWKRYLSYFWIVGGDERIWTKILDY